MTCKAGISASLFHMNIYFVQIVFMQVANNRTNIQFVFDLVVSLLHEFLTALSISN